MPRYSITETDVCPVGDAITPLPDYSMAQRMLCAAICAYDVTKYDYYPPTFNPPTLYWTPIESTQPAQLITADVSLLHPARDAAFITQTTDGWVVLSLRGTLPPTSVHGLATFLAFFDDWYNDSKSKRVPFIVKGAYYGGVHKGFHESYEAMLHQIKKVLDGVDWADPKIQGLQVTGHSKGAALTFLYALWALKTYSSSGLKTVNVNAYAPPAVGDSYFANMYNHAKIPTMRHQRANDLVPFMLPTSGGTYGGYDVYKHLHGSVLNFTEDAVWTLGKLVHGDYYTVGDLTFYPGDVPGSKPSEGGATGEVNAQAKIIKTIGADEGGRIADAHSATASYFPALF